MKAYAKFHLPVQESLVLIAYADSESLKTEGMWIKALAKILGTVHEKYHICEQRMIWRGCIAQSRQSLR